MRLKDTPVHRHEARVSWSRNGADFARNRYSRGHEWSFDGGVTVPASASPHIVTPRYTVAEAVDPEEALVAAASSCHMLTFLSMAATAGFIVDSYVDEASGVMEKNAKGRLAFTSITLRPRIVFSGEKLPTSHDLDALHHAAHEECFIANSVNFEIVVEAP